MTYIVEVRASCLKRWTHEHISDEYEQQVAWASLGRSALMGRFIGVASLGVPGAWAARPGLFSLAAPLTSTGSRITFSGLFAGRLSAGPRLSGALRLSSSDVRRAFSGLAAGRVSALRDCAEATGGFFARRPASAAAAGAAGGRPAVEPVLSASCAALVGACGSFLPVLARICACPSHHADCQSRSTGHILAH